MLYNVWDTGRPRPDRDTSGGKRAGREEPMKIMAEPFLSVMVPVYNGEEYLADSVGSVLSQPCDDLEVIILNDGSTDGTLRVAERLAASDPRVTVRSHENVGMGANRNGGIPLMRGRWFLFLDDDDAVRPGFYTESVRSLLSDLEAAGVETVVPARIRANEGLDRGMLDRVPLEGVMPGEGPACLNLPYEFATMLYRGDMLRRENLRFSEGWPEMESIFRHQAVCLSERTLFTNDIWFAVRRDNPTQITRTWDWPKVVPVRAERYAALAEWHRQRGSAPEVLAWAERTAADAAADAERLSGRRPLLERMRAKRDERRGRKAWLDSLGPISELYPSPEEHEAAVLRVREAAGL